MVDNSAIWKTNPDNSWRLFNHTDYKPKDTRPVPKETKDKKGSPAQTKPQVSTPFSFSKTKPMTKGSTACTPKGYGVVQAFNEDKGTITVKIEGQVLEFPQDEVLGDIPLNVTFVNNTLRTEEIMYVPIASTMNEVIERMENSLNDEESLNSVSLYSNGKEQQGSTDTLEKLKILPWTKFLGIVKNKKPMLVKRFINSAGGWSLAVGNHLGIAFSPSKTIRVIGIALYKPCPGGTLSGNANFYYGSSVKGEPAATKSVSITTDMSEMPQGGLFGDKINSIHVIEKVMFPRSFVVKAGEFACVTFLATSQCPSCYYGNGGRQSIEGEGEVNFTFKVCEDMPYLAGFDSGQVPEIYYYV